MKSGQTNHFEEAVTDIIKRRSSVRTYREKPLSENEKDSFARYLSDVTGPFDTRIRFKLIDNKNILKESNIKLGTYGVIKGASCYIAAAVEKGGRCHEQAGFAFEKVVLFATSKGLGTCWMGGTFRKSDFAKAIDLRENEILPVISPVGYANEKRSIVDTLFRLGAGSKNRKGWDELFFYGSFDNPISQPQAGDCSIPLEMVRLAPSASNKQPWRVVRKDNNYHFYLQRNKGYANAIGFDIQRLDIGIAMCHFQLTMEEMGMIGEWVDRNPDIGRLPEYTEYIISWVEKQRI